MIAYYGNEISPNQTETEEGYLICRNVPIARIGEMDYAAGELGLSGDENAPVEVWRYPEDVFAPEALSSFEGKPVTDGHPFENVVAENYAAYEKGHIENVRRDGDFVVADLYIKDPSLISDIKNGVKREVSCGYMCTYEPHKSGYKQTHIRGNHVAVVPNGRAGRSVAIKDSADGATNKERSFDMGKMTKTILSAFGSATRDADPEEVKEAADVCADEQAADKETLAKAEPEKAEDVCADEVIYKEQEGVDLGTKIDKILGLLERMIKGADGKQEARRLRDEGDIDEIIDKLAGEKESEPAEDGYDGEEAVTVPNEEFNDSAMSRDSAVRLLKKVRPAVAGISDKTERARVVDAFIGAIKDGGVMGDIVRENEQRARKMSHDTKRANYEELCKAQKEAYDARNPHKIKEEK